MQIAWPGEVPILSAEDMHKGGFDGPNDTHSLGGWATLVFVGGVEMFGVAIAIADEAGVRRTYQDINDFNKAPGIRRSTLAKVWNRAMASLGYVVGNPEAGDDQ